MKTSELAKLPLNQTIVQFNKGINKVEADPDPGMRAILKSISLDEEGCYKILLDFSQHEEFNRPLGKTNYYDKDHQPTETWFQMSYYERDKAKYELYVMGDDDVMDLVETSALWGEFLKTGQMDYVAWLENELLTLRDIAQSGETII